MCTLPSKPTNINERRQMDVASKALSRAVPILMDFISGRNTVIAEYLARQLLEDMGILEANRPEPKTARNTRKLGII